MDAAKAGAAIVHIHVRDPKTTKPSMDGALYAKWSSGSEKSSDVLINLTTGPGARFYHDDNDPSKPSADFTLRGPEERVQHVIELRPDICSLDMGSLNMGDRVFVNTPPHLQAMALAIKDAGVTPELEVFETGHLMLAKRFLEDGYVKPPGMFQICLGISWGQPATPEAMSYMRSLLPKDCTWFAFGISLCQFPMVAQAVLLGGHPRVGLRTTSIWKRASSRRATRRWSRRRPRSSKFWAIKSRRPTMQGKSSAQGAGRRQRLTREFQSFPCIRHSGAPQGGDPEFYSLPLWRNGCGEWIRSRNLARPGMTIACRRVRSAVSIQRFDLDD